MVASERARIGLEYVSGDLREQLIGQGHQRAIVAVRLVELQHRELGVVLGRDPLIAKIAVDLVHPLNPSDDQPLQIQLWGNAQVQREVQGVCAG